MADHAVNPLDPAAADMVAAGVDALSTWRERLADPFADLAPVVEHVLTAALNGRIVVDPHWLRRKVELADRIVDVATTQLGDLSRHLATLTPRDEAVRNFAEDCLVRDPDCEGGLDHSDCEPPAQEGK